MGATAFYLLMLPKYTNLKQKILKQKKKILCLGNISKDFSSINIKKIRLNGYFCKFSVNYNIIDTSSIINIQKHLMNKREIK